MPKTETTPATQPRNPRKVNAWDVAEKAGVSQSTVSRVFTGSTRISQATRERVLAAARALDYVPDKRASRLRSGQTGVLAVVVITRPEDDARELNPFVYALLGSVCRAASARGFETLVSFQASEDEFYGRYIEQRDADAMVVLGTSRNPKGWAYFRPLLGGESRAVCWGLPFDEATSVRSDNRRGGQIAAEHLWAKGYRKPVFVGPQGSNHRQYQERFEGFAEALRALGGEPRRIERLESRDRIDQGREAVARLESEGVEYDSIFAACDFLALGALEALQQSAIAVPEQVGVIGFDALPATAHASPPLTTIEPDLEEAGRQLVDAVLPSPDGSERALPALARVRLIERASTQRAQ